MWLQLCNRDDVTKIKTSLFRDACFPPMWPGIDSGPVSFVGCTVISHFAARVFRRVVRFFTRIENPDTASSLNIIIYLEQSSFGQHQERGVCSIRSLLFMCP